MTVSAGGGVVRVAVAERAGPGVPVLVPDAGGEAEGNRGMRLVDMLAARWGYERYLSAVPGAGPRASCLRESLRAAPSHDAQHSKVIVCWAAHPSRSPNIRLLLGLRYRPGAGTDWPVMRVTLGWSPRRGGR